MLNLRGSVIRSNAYQSQVHNAGHMVPMDQPKAALEMLKWWTHDMLADSTADLVDLVADT